MIAGLCEFLPSEITSLACTCGRSEQRCQSEHCSVMQASQVASCVPWRNDVVSLAFEDSSAATEDKELAHGEVGAA